MGKRKELSGFSDLDLVYELQDRGLTVAAYGPGSLENVVPVSMTLHAESLRSASITTNVRRFNLREILDKCFNEARKGRFEASVDVDYTENDQRDLLRTLEHYGYAVTVANKFNEGQNTFYIRW